MRRKRIGILTGGGDVPPLNAVLEAAQRAAAKKQIELIGFQHGWRGVLEDRFVPLARLRINPQIGGTILKSSRVNLAKTPDGVALAVRTLQKNRVEGLIVIGGEDTLSNSLLLGDFPQVLISKTIDNDVGIMPKSKGLRLGGIVNYFTLGYPTAAKKIASFVSLKEGVRTTAYSHERIIIVESMGMHAGWLALASAPGDPDFIVIPEFPLDYGMFKEKVIERYTKARHVVIVTAEGARWRNGSYLSADESETDDFGHPRFKGAAEVLARKLKQDLKGLFDTRNVNCVNPSYLYRSGRPCDLDLIWANKLGRRAVGLLAEDPSISVFLTIKREGADFELHPYKISAMQSIEALHRFVDERFYDPRQLAITISGRKYLSAINKCI